MAAKEGMTMGFFTGRATFARYLEREDGQWQRQPHSKVSGFIPATDGWTDQMSGRAELRLRRVGGGGRHGH